MEGLVRRRFTPDDAVGSKVYKREYDLLSPNGEIILSETWQLLIRPGWIVGMRLWTASQDEQRRTGPPIFSNLLTYGNNATPSTGSSSLRPPPFHDGASSATSSSGMRKKSSLRSWFSGRKSSRFQIVDESD